MAPKTSLALSFLASATLIASAVAAQPVAEGGRKFTTTLTGQAELTGGAATADLDGSGTARVTVNPGQQRVCWDITVANLDTLTAAHIHRASATATGGIVVTFFHFGDPVDLEGCTTTPLSRALLKEIMQTPQNFYVNVHTSVYPSGAIRGQLAK
jgi:hypothetical protein